MLLWPRKIRLDSLFKADLFLRRFREGISFPNFVCPLLYRTEHLFRGEKRAKRCREKGRKTGWPAKRAKRKKGRVKIGQKGVRGFKGIMFIIHRNKKQCAIATRFRVALSATKSHNRNR